MFCVKSRLCTVHQGVQHGTRQYMFSRLTVRYDTAKVTAPSPAPYPWMFWGDHLHCVVPYRSCHVMSCNVGAMRCNIRRWQKPCFRRRRAFTSTGKLSLPPRQMEVPTSSAPSLSSPKAPSATLETSERLKALSESSASRWSLSLDLTLTRFVLCMVDPSID